MSDFIEYPALNRPPYDWRNKLDESSADCIIVLQKKNAKEDVSADCVKKYYVHLRVLCLSSDFFYKIPARNTKDRQNVSAVLEYSSDSSCGDLHIRFQDGSSFRMGNIMLPFSMLKNQIQERFRIPVFEQMLLPSNRDCSRDSLLQDWRSPAGCGLEAGDSVLLVQKPWHQYDPSTKTLTLNLPEICTRHVLEI